MAYLFAQAVALDQYTGLLIKNVVGSIYSENDPSYTTPLTVTDLTGNTSLSITANNDGLIPSFYADETPVVWKSGTTSPVTLWSPKQFSDKAEAAQAAAEAAETAAQAAQSAAYAPATDVVTSVLNSGSFTPTGAFDFTNATVTGLTGGGNTADLVVTDVGAYYTFNVLDGGSVIVTDQGTYLTVNV